MDYENNNNNNNDNNDNVIESNLNDMNININPSSTIISNNISNNISRIPGPSPLNVQPNNIYDYCCGSFTLIQRDIQLLLNINIAQIIINKIKLYLMPAFRLREELINMKKVAYHIYKQGSSIERSLSQVATFFRLDHFQNNTIDTDTNTGTNTIDTGIGTDIDTDTGIVIDTNIATTPTPTTPTPTNWYWKHSDRFTEIADARMRCKGACHAASDARALAKNICCIPRYSSEARPSK